MTVHPAGAEGLAWIELRAPCILTRDARAIEARTPSGEIAGVVAFDGWTPSSAQMHVAIEQPAAMLALRRRVFRYLFEDSGRTIALGVVRASNKHALRFDQALGFREVGRLRDGWAIGEDLVVLELRKADCHWLKKGHVHG